MKILKKGLIKIKICKEYTYVKYSGKHFKTRSQAIKSAIKHLERILEKYNIKKFDLNDKNTN